MDSAANSATDLNVRDLKLAFARLEARMEALHANRLRWLVAMFVPLWVGTWTTFVAVVLKT